MITQIIQDHNGAPTGVFIPIKAWEEIKNQYPEIEFIDENIPQWEMDLIDSRLEMISKNPERLQPIESLMEKLKRKI